MPEDAWDCAEEDKITSYVDCPEEIVEDTCSNYTFTKTDFSLEEPVTISNDLAFGQACWMEIDRTPDGSYGTVALTYDNHFLYVFDE